jgi:hypothetical protein
MANVSVTVPSANPLGGLRVSDLEVRLSVPQSLKLAQIHAGLVGAGATNLDGSGFPKQADVVKYLLENLV